MTMYTTLANMLTLACASHLQVSAAMPEAWKEAWQTATPSIPGQAAAAPVTLMKAAQQLGVGVFASGPLLEVRGLLGLLACTAYEHQKAQICAGSTE